MTFNDFPDFQAFEDTNVLMSQAKEMVQLSKKITEKLKATGLGDDEVRIFA